MDVIGLLDTGFAWTADRIRNVAETDLTAPTPCDQWNLRKLLNHLHGAVDVVLGSVGQGRVLTTAGINALAGEDRIGTDPAAAFTDLAARACATYRVPGALDRDCLMGQGTSIPARSAVIVSVMELTVHGWDIGRSSGENADIPAGLAEPLLGFARKWPHVEGQRGVLYGPAIPGGTTPAECLLGLLGRKP
jgi:uncharacterized protein (TIGR03086 family)